MDLSELNEIINDIKKTTINKSILSLKSLDNELNNIKFEMKCKEETINNVKEWLMYNPSHTFPKKKYRWINTLTSQRGLRQISFDCNVKELLNIIKYNKPIPQHLSSLTVYLYDCIKYDENTNEIIGNYNTIYVYVDAEKVYNNLINCGLIYQKYFYTRVHINKLQLTDKYNICDDSVYDDYSMVDSMYNIINNSKKRLRDDESDSEEYNTYFKKSRNNYNNFKLTTPVFKI